MDGREIPPVQLCHISVYLLFLLRQNPVDHIAVELAVLVQLPHFLCLRQRGRGLLPLNGYGDIPLIFGTDE
jgi:hypothetical protein